MTPPILYLDVSEIVVERGNSGIQRVVRRLVEGGRQFAPEYGVRIVPVVSVADGLRALSSEGEAALSSSAPLAGGIATEPEVGQRSGYLKRVLKLMPSLYERLRFRKLERALTGLYLDDSITIQSSDTYVIIDSFWLRSSAPRTAVRLRKRDHRVVALIYDALSLTHPQYFTSELPKTFAAALTKMARGDVAFLSISETAAASLEINLPKLPQGRVPSFKLGHDIPVTTTDAEAVWPAELWTDAAGAAPVFLMVGTFEPRKNHSLVLEAFEALWRDGFTGKLVLIGRPGWGVADLLTRIESHPEAGRRLFVFHAASDALLVDAYARATATIVASHAEGFGLPLVESLAHRLPVLASDIDVFREIAPDACLFFDPTSPLSLVLAVRSMSSDLVRYQDNARRFTWPDWQDATRSFVSIVLDLAERQRR